MGSTADLANADVTSLGVSPDAFPITPGAGAIVNPEGEATVIRALRADTDCNVTCKTPGSGSTTRVIKFLAGETRYIAMTHVTVVSAGAVEGIQ